MSRWTNVIDMVKGLLASVTGDRVNLVASVTDPALLDTQLENVVVVCGAAASPLKSTPYRVLSAILVAGPLAGGVTANTSTVFVGTKSVALNSGFPLTPGAQLALGPCDLSEVWVFSSTPTDTVRVLALGA